MGGTVNSNKILSERFLKNDTVPNLPMHKLFEREAAKLKIPQDPRIPLGKHGHVGDRLDGRTASSTSVQQPKAEPIQDFVRVKHLNRISLTSFKQT